MFPYRFPVSGRHFAIIQGCSGFGLHLASLIRAEGGRVSLLGGDEDLLHDAACTLQGARIVLRRGDPLLDLDDLLRGATPADYLIMPAGMSPHCAATPESGHGADGPCNASALVAKALQLTPSHCQITLLGPEDQPLDEALLALLSEHASPAPILIIKGQDMAANAAAVLEQILSRRVRLQFLRGRLRLEDEA